MTPIIESIIDLFNLAIDLMVWLFNTVTSWIASFFTEWLPTIIWTLAPEGLADYLTNLVDLATMAAVVEQVTWFLPFWQCMKIYLGAIALVAAVRLVRYVIGWIPTVEG